MYINLGTYTHTHIYKLGERDPHSLVLTGFAGVCLFQKAQKKGCNHETHEQTASVL